MSDLQTDMSLVLETEHGRRLMKHLIDSSGCDAVKFTGEFGQDSFTRGQQSMGIAIKNLAFDADLERYIQLIRESHYG